MPDKTALGISEELRQFIEALVNEVVLEGKPFENQKYLQLFCRAEGVDYDTLEKNITEFFEVADEWKRLHTKSSLLAAKMLAKACFLSDNALIILMEGNSSSPISIPPDSEIDLQHYINALVEEVILEEKPLESNNKSLRRFCEDKCADYQLVVNCLSEFIETSKELEVHESRGAKRLLIILGKQCYLSDDEMNIIISTIDKRRKEFEKKHIEEESANNKALENAKSLLSKFGKESLLSEEKIQEIISTLDNHINLVALEDKIKYLEHDLKRKERIIDGYKEDLLKMKQCIEHHIPLFVIVLFVSVVEFFTFVKWGWAFVPLVVSVTFSTFRILTVKDEDNWEYNNNKSSILALSFIPIIIINVAAFFFPNAWSLLVLITIFILSLYVTRKYNG